MKKRVAILISGRGSNMMALVEAARAPGLSGRDRVGHCEQARRRGPRPGPRPQDSRRLPSTTRPTPRARRSMTPCTPPSSRRGADLDCSRRVHAHPVGRLRPQMAGAAAQHPPLAPAPVQGAASAQAGARRRGQNLGLHACISSPRRWTAARSSPRRRCRCWKAILRRPWQRGFSLPSTSFIRTRLPWWPRAALAWRQAA